MYEAFFQFMDPPFNLTPDPKFLYLSPAHQEALGHMLYGAQQRKGFIVITGEVGAGKTTLTRMFLDCLDNHTDTALIVNTLLGDLELLKAINREFGISTAGSTREELIQELNRFLISQMNRGRNSVLIIDEAQNLAAPVLELIRMLSNLETDTTKLLQIILVGQPELIGVLGRPELRQLSQRVAVRYHLRPLAYQDTVRYILHRVMVAGLKSTVRFNRRSFRLIHRQTQGVPRRINALCDRTLLIAYTKNKHVIQPRFVRQARRELAGVFSPARSGASGRVLVFALLAALLAASLTLLSLTSLAEVFRP